MKVFKESLKASGNGKDTNNYIPRSYLLLKNKLPQDLTASKSICFWRAGFGYGYWWDSALQEQPDWEPQILSDHLSEAFLGSFPGSLPTVQFLIWHLALSRQVRKTNLVWPSPRSDIPLHLVYFSHCKWVAVVLHVQGDGFPQGLIAGGHQCRSFQRLCQPSRLEAAMSCSGWLLWAGV